MASFDSWVLLAVSVTSSWAACSVANDCDRLTDHAPKMDSARMHVHLDVVILIRHILLLSALCY